MNIYNLTNMNSITLDTQAVKDNQIVTKAYVDQFHQENEQSRKDLDIKYLMNQMIWLKTSNIMISAIIN